MIAKGTTCEADKTTKRPESAAAYQDATYGKGMRVQNPKGTGDSSCVCTACGTTNSVGKGTK